MKTTRMWPPLISPERHSIRNEDYSRNSVRKMMEYPLQEEEKKKSHFQLQHQVTDQEDSIRPVTSRSPDLPYEVET